MLKIVLHQGILSGSYNFRKLEISTEALHSSHQSKVQLLLILIETLDLENVLQMVHDEKPFRYHIICKFFYVQAIIWFILCQVCELWLSSRMILWWYLQLHWNGLRYPEKNLKYTRYVFSTMFSREFWWMPRWSNKFWDMPLSKKFASHAIFYWYILLNYPHL